MKRYVIINGGLGNQMFQYAFYLSLKAKGIECLLDTSLFHFTEMHNGFELGDVFSVKEVSNSSSILTRNWIHFLYKYKPSCFLSTDRPYIYDDKIYGSSKRYFLGDWLSYKYFEAIIPKIVETYKFQSVSSRNNIESEIIKKENSVSLHVRRGDYLNLPNYCVCDERYYEKAIRHIQENVSSPFFYVFSNDPMWCEDFMRKFNVPFKIVDWNQGKDSCQDMYLMTQCKHNIIANSTFSWWGAWLNQNKNKIVVAPSHWFRNSDKNINCPGWVLIDTSKQNGK